MSTIYLIRHARTVMNIDGKWQGRNDSDIPQESIQHYRALSARLLDKGITAIYSSPLGRAIKSAVIVADIIGIESISIVKDLMERDLGLMEGHTTDEVKKAYGINEVYIASREIEKIPFVEPWPDFVYRVMKTLEDLKEKDGALVVTHGGVMRAIYNTITKTNEPRVIFDNGFIMKLEYETGWKIAEIIGP